MKTINLTSVKNVILDLGGVIYDIRYENIADAFQSYGITDFTQYYTQAQQSELIDLFEEGKISTGKFREYIRSISPIDLTDKQIDDAWNAIMIDIPLARVEFLKRLKEKYRLFLFSNTNQINYDFYVPFVKEKFGYNIFEELFEKAYFSHILQMRKPNPEGFMAICKENNLIPSETLFIDDTERHIKGAERCGLQTLWLQGELCDMDFLL